MGNHHIRVSRVLKRSVKILTEKESRLILVESEVWKAVISRKYKWCPSILGRTTVLVSGSRNNVYNLQLWALSFRFTRHFLLFERVGISGPICIIFISLTSLFPSRGFRCSRSSCAGKLYYRKASIELLYYNKASMGPLNSPNINVDMYTSVFYHPRSPKLFKCSRSIYTDHYDLLKGLWSLEHKSEVFRTYVNIIPIQ